MSEFPKKLYVTVNHDRKRKINVSRSIKGAMDKWETDYKDIAEVAEYRLVDSFHAHTEIKVTRP